MPSSKAPSDKKPKLGTRWFLKFARQEIASQWKPIPSKVWSIGFYLVLACFFVTLGAVFLEQTRSVVQLRERYDNKGLYASLSQGERYSRLQDINSVGGRGLNKISLEFNVTVREDMEPPVYVFYELTQFYQNHKRYVRSLSSQQLGGEDVNDPNECDPRRRLVSDANHTVEGNGLIVPCGLIASSFFNDSYTLKADGDEVKINGTGIAWEWDREALYGNIQPQNFNPEWNRFGGNLTGSVNENERFMVWMRVSAAPDARKLYGKIEKKLHKGTVLTFTAQNRYNTYRYGGKKYIVLSTANWTGGRNTFIGVLYLVVGGISALAAFSIFLTDYSIKRPPADLEYLSWRKAA